MKAIRLFIAAMLLGAGIQATAQNVDQTSDVVIDIPTTADWQLDPKDATIKMVTSAYVTFKEDGVTEFVEPQRYKATDDEGHNQFDNMYNKDWAQFKLNNTAEKAYIIRFQTACKKDGSQIRFELKSGDDVDLDYTYNVPNNGNWKKWQDGVIFINDPIEVGAKTLTITFLNEDGTTTANLRNLRFEGVDGSIETYSLYVYKYVGETENEACGTVTVAPQQDVYVKNSEVTLTATPNLGYKFVKWVDNYGDEYTEPTLKVIIEGSTDISAYFEEVEMGNAVPGKIDLDSRYYRAYGQVDEVDGLRYLSNYRPNQYEQFQLSVKADGNYTLNFKASRKDKSLGVLTFVIEQDGAEAGAEPEYQVEQKIELTGNWKKFQDYSIEGVKLTAGKKLMTIKFNNEGFATDSSDKYGVNVADIEFVDPNGTEGIQGVTTQADGSRRAFNLMGMEVNAATAKGLVIVNGKKMWK